MSYKIASEEVSDKLCGLCTVSLDVCSASRSSGNAFAGNDGALECMAAGQGDVAFIKHTTLQEVADKWNVSDYHHYQYLCKDGTREGRSLADLDLQMGRGSQKKCFSAIRASVWSKNKPPPPPPPLPRACPSPGSATVYTSKPSVFIRVDTKSNADPVFSLAQDTESIELYKCRGTGQFINSPE